MGLSKYKLGNLIELVSETNSKELYGPEAVRGISNLKEMMSTKADLHGRDLSKFQIVRPGTFVFNHRTSRNGSKFSITYNYDSVPHIFTEDYVVFRIKEDCENILLKEWLHMYFCRAEFDRFVITNSWGSSTEFYNWQDLCDFDITLPSIEQQRKYVDVYLSLQNNLATYQSKVDDLKLVCDGYIENLRRKMPCEKIGKYISRESKNTDGQIKKVLGIGQNGFMEPQKDPNASLRNYKVLRKGDIAYAPPLYNILTGALHCYDGDEDAVCSPIYEVFRCDNEHLLPEYLTMWLKRDEFIRYAEFYAQGVRQTFEYSLMEEIEIPIPDINIQHSITDIFKVYKERMSICEELKLQIKYLCPILIKGSLETWK